MQFRHVDGAGGRLVTKRGLNELHFIDSLMQCARCAHLLLLLLTHTVQVDLLLAVRREYNLASYKLDAVARHFLADSKVDLSPKAMMALWREGTPEAKARIGAYCLQDTLLPLRLANRLDVFSSLFEMANATYVPCDFILQRGQTIKCFSPLVHAMHKCGLLAPDEIHEQDNDGGYAGATLLEPIRGAYFQPCGVCDFATLVRHLARSPAYVVMLRLVSGVAVLTPLRERSPG